jgi:serine/threonine protein kinase
MQWNECKLFEREAQVLQHLEHPRIPRYKNYFVLDRQEESRFSWFVLVESYISGSSLQQLLDRSKRFSEAEVEKIAVEVLSILVYLHELDPPLVHRDLKPSNLIWGEDERIYLVDFGAVQDQGVVEGVTFTVVGTYGYVPMEQFGGRAVPASDLYALGATLIHLLTGIAPADLPQRDARIEFADRVSIDPGLVNWIGKLTEPSLAERLSTASEALEALKNRHKLSPPITNPKPVGSKIQLQKSTSQLEIKIPRRGKKAVRGFLLLGAIVSTILPFLFARFPDSWYLPLLVLILGWLGWFGITSIVFPIFKQTELYFDRENFEIRWMLFGWCYRRLRGKTVFIDRIYEEEIKDNKVARGVAIEDGKRQFTTTPLATLERLWLIDEIRDWLSSILNV